jgi:hypothetical protein
MMRSFLAAALCTALAFPAFADAASPPDPNQLAEREARQFLRPCEPRYKGEYVQLCLVDQRNFIEQYVYAKAGDYMAQGSTAYSFDTHRLPDDLSWTGMPQNQVQSCAWRIVIVQYGHPDVQPFDAELMGPACSPLSRVEQVVAGRRADELLRSLRASPARMPADDWEPAMPGLVEP